MWIPNNELGSEPNGKIGNGEKKTQKDIKVVLKSGGQITKMDMDSHRR